MIGLRRCRHQDSWWYRFQYAIVKSVYWVGLGCLDLVMWMTWHLEGLNSMFHLWLQVQIIHLDSILVSKMLSFERPCFHYVQFWHMKNIFSLSLSLSLCNCKPILKIRQNAPFSVIVFNMSRGIRLPDSRRTRTPRLVPAITLTHTILISFTHGRNTACVTYVYVKY